MRDVPLVELVVTGNEHGGGPAVGSPRAPGLLPHGCQRAREAVEHDGVEAADVDSQLERVGGRNAEESAARELELERASLRREVAGPVRSDTREPSPGSICSRRARACWATTSAPRRLRVNASVGWPARTNRARSSAVSTLADPRAPECSSRSGRCQQASTRSERGDPSWSICSTGNPHNSPASAPGLPIVALAKQNVGLGAVVLADRAADGGARARRGCRRCRAGCAARRPRRSAGASRMWPNAGATAGSRRGACRDS